MRPTVLLVAPDFRCATGMTPALVAGHGRRFRYRLFPARDLRFRRRTYRRLAAGADVVHWHANLAHFPGLAEVDGPVRIATVHHLEPDDAYVLDAAVAAADQVHVPSRGGAAVLADHGVDRPVAVAPYVIEPPPRERRRAADGRWVVGWCGSAGAPEDRKRLGDLVAALALLADRRPVLALQGAIDPTITELAAAAAVTVDPRPSQTWADRWRFYDGIDLYCSPSSVEGGPLPVFEAAALGVPVVTTAVGMAADLLDADGAWPAPVGDPVGLAEALARLADTPAAERADRVERARALARDLGPPTGVDRHEALYAEVLGLDPPAGRRSRQPTAEQARARLGPLSRTYRQARVTVHRLRNGRSSTPYPS